MKHILKVTEIFDFDHTKEELIESISGFDFNRTQKLVERAMKFKLTSERIEFLMFGNTESLKIRVMAIYGLGLIIGGRNTPKEIVINIKEI